MESTSFMILLLGMEKTTTRNAMPPPRGGFAPQRHPREPIVINSFMDVVGVDLPVQYSPELRISKDTLLLHQPCSQSSTRPKAKLTMSFLSHLAYESYVFCYYWPLFLSSLCVGCGLRSTTTSLFPHSLLRSLPTRASCVVLYLRCTGGKTLRLGC